MGQYAEWDVEDEIFGHPIENNFIQKEFTNKNKSYGVRNYIENNSHHIKHFYKKNTKTENMQTRINCIIKLYSNCESVKQGTLKISEDFKQFKIWHKSLRDLGF